MFKEIIDAYRQNLFAREGEKRDVLILYKNLPALDVTDEDGKSLYHIAATFADYEAIEFLSEGGLKVRADEKENTPLHDLSKSPLTNDIKNFGKREDDIRKTVKRLIDLKVNPKKKNEAGEIAYYIAGTKLMYPFIEALADKSVKMDATGEEGKNLLHLICSQLYHKKKNAGVPEAAYKTIEALLKSGVDPEDKDIFDTTPLTYAQRSDVKEIAALLSGNEGDLQTGGMTIKEAVLKKDIEAIECLLKSGTDINEVSEDYRTPLMSACEYPSLDIIELLTKGGADVNYVSGENGHTAVYYLLNSAIRNLNVGVVGGQDVKTITKILQVLIDNDLDTNVTIDNNGNTALNFVCSLGYMDGINNKLAESLIDAGSNINLPTLTGKTPLMTFAEKGDEPKHNIAELLLDNEADTTLLDKNSYTALMYAAGNSNKMSAKKIAELILDADKSTIENTNNNGETALDIAVKAANEAVVKLLLNNM
ncbi:ankyrin repeat domain-containing protein [Dysgonomonas sp. HGC4]|uniref:ankyrin repeat domain-containing protein n=1 Tax=Dysgonomonas sp. HGC4 TaxID=1658009 RepID=UPI00067FDEA2|nr:ankyrin repeat domain-containing protein [Dysgonomonas sp. HGC4]MBD8348187.1 ankyrin repeat domain-containing protein [Dysgonomonas sp. HGC4]